MADFTNNKPLGSVYPAQSADAQEWSRVEPLITPQQLKDRFLFGIPLYSSFRDPISNEFAEMSPDLLKDYIDRATAEAELDTGITIFPVQYKEKYPFDMNWWTSFGYLKTKHSPVSSVQSLSFTSSSGQAVFSLSLDWIESANFDKGQINIIPMVPASAAQFVSSTPTSGTGNAFLTFLGGLGWIPALIEVKYVSGFPDGTVPRTVNELIGINAALEILGMLQATNKATSYSLSLDGASQSVTTPGSDVYTGRINYLLDKKAGLVKRLKTVYGLNLTSSYV